MNAPITAASIKAQRRAAADEEKKRDLTKLTERIEFLTSRVPKKVLLGSHQTAVAWKDQAKAALAQICKVNANIDHVRAMCSALEQYE